MNIRADRRELHRPEVREHERQHDEQQRGRPDADQLRPHARLTAALAEEPGRPHEQHRRG